MNFKVGDKVIAYSKLYIIERVYFNSLLTERFHLVCFGHGVVKNRWASADEMVHATDLTEALYI